MIILLKNKDTLKVDDFFFKCSIGKKGKTYNKKEGDLKTPKGIFGIGRLFYRADKLKDLMTWQKRALENQLQTLKLSR